MKLRPLAVIDEQDSQIWRNVAIAKRVHIIEKRQVAHYGEIKPIFIRQARAKCGTHAAIYAKAADIAIRPYSARKVVKIPRANGV